MIKANDSRSSIRRHGTSNRKFSHSNRFILQKNSPACTTDAVLRKYVDTSARCTSFGPYFNNANQNPFYNLNLPRPKITTANVCATRPPLPLDLQGGKQIFPVTASQSRPRKRLLHYLKFDIQNKNSFDRILYKT
jgi:hypothetical protein